ncbi:hypothetical protein BZL41_05610 [Pseudomonas sp. PIC25]|uniref:hypothetical protein n=1 Tax=Pseudomonas sp. PIC25 TaxID=1958773 RepID=UPI000BAC0546|nr:hypothetical protein [Pseudomonas sp. PIC25]PAU65649.1 hypothetical protein BZL41_05610 [Pseudomonas sp. PIC25]
MPLHHKAALACAAILCTVASIGWLLASGTQATNHQAASVKADAPTASTQPGKPAPGPADTAAAQTGKPKQDDEKTLQLLMQPDPNPYYATFGDRLQEVLARRDGQAVDPKKLWTALQEKAAWKPLEGSPDQLPLTAEQRSDGREFISIDPLKIESLVPGDHLEVPIAQANQTYDVVIDHVRSTDGQSMTWSGHIEELSQDNQVTITRGNGLIVGGITTPQGLYALQAHGNQGWIATSATLFKGGDKHIEVPSGQGGAATDDHPAGH